MNRQHTEISIISPVYCAEGIVDELIKRIDLAVSRITDSYEIILIEDGSPDQSWSKIESAARLNKRIKGIKLSRNFGQHHAISAGLDIADGAWVVVMDCDLQDQPEEIEKLYKKGLEGFDLVFAERMTRGDSFFKRLKSKVFYSVFSYLTGVKQDGRVGNFGIYSRKVVLALRRMTEPFRAFSPMVRWVGFKKVNVGVEHVNRFAGKSSYNWSRLLSLGLDIAICYSDKPLKLTIKLGAMISLLSVFYTIYNLIAYQMGIIKLSGFASLIISIWFLSGLIIFTLGVMGLYLSKTFEGVKNRPIYLVEKEVNLD